MNILLYNPSATSGGGKAILEDEYKHLLSVKDDNEYFFVTGDIGLKSVDNIHVSNYAWVKKSWLHRVWFDCVTANRIIKKLNINEIITYQNMLVPSTRVKQTMYLQQAIPFSDIKVSLKDDKTIWLYQNIIGRIVLTSVKRADRIIVQTNWMKDACIKKLKIPADRISVEAPKVEVPDIYKFKSINTGCVEFFYPASGLFHKNHRIVIEACKLLKQRGLRGYCVIFTINANDSNISTCLFEEARANSLPIEFIGSIPREAVFSKLCEAYLLFPSKIETFGLPLAEARKIGSPVLASNTAFSREILNEYDGADFFDPDDMTRLAGLMQDAIIKQRSL